MWLSLVRSHRYFQSQLHQLIELSAQPRIQRTLQYQLYAQKTVRSIHGLCQTQWMNGEHQFPLSKYLVTILSKPLCTRPGDDAGEGKYVEGEKKERVVFFPGGDVIVVNKDAGRLRDGASSEALTPVEVIESVPQLPEVWGRVHSIESFSAVDGPGLRSVIFLQGCMRRCLYCANPDTWSPLDRCKRLSSRDIATRLRKNLPYLTGGGGVTVSGGEPLLQPDFCAAIFREAHQMNINTALDTAGYGDPDQWAKVLPHTDVVMLCVKAMDPRLYLKLTGIPQREMLLFARHVGMYRIPLVVRYVLVPGLTDTEEEIQALGEFSKAQPSLEGIEILPYHTLGKNKWIELGLSYPLEGVPSPTKESVEKVRTMLEQKGIQVLV